MFWCLDRERSEKQSIWTSVGSMGKVRKRLCMTVPLEILTSPSLSFWTKASLSLSKHNQSIQKSSHACIMSYSHNKHGTGDANHMQTSSTGKDKGEVVSSLGKSFPVFIRLAILPWGMICLDCHLFSLLVVASLGATQHWKKLQHLLPTLCIGKSCKCISTTVKPYWCFSLLTSVRLWGLC